MSYDQSRQHEKNSFHEQMALSESMNLTTVNDAFNCVAMSLSICDISEIYLAFEKLRLTNITDIKAYFREHPQKIKETIRLIKLVNVNQATRTLFKFDTLSESKDQQLYALLDEAVGPLLDAAEAIWTEQDYFSTRIRLRDSKQAPFIALLSFYPPKNLLEAKSLCLSIMDISMEIEQEQRLLAVADALPDLTFITAEDGTILEVMSNQQHLLYQPKATILDKKMQDIIPGQVGQNILDTIQATVANKQKHTLEYPLKINDTICWFEGSCSPIQGDFKGYKAVVWLAKDITENKLLEEHLRYFQKMEAISALTGGIAHEFNNLLSPILGYSDLMLQNRELGEFENHALETINNASKRASELVKQLLAYSGLTMSQQSEIKLANLIEELKPLLVKRQNSKISITTDLNPDLPTITGIVDDLKTVVINICDNAMNAMPEGGKLIISQKLATRTERETKLPYIALQITDNGTGIPLKIIDRIFEPFFTTREVGEGTGLGLSVVHGIVKQHSGHVEVESKVGVGTTVTILLPLQPQFTSYDKPSKPKSNKQRKCILVVDDDPMVLELIAIMLTQMNYQVTALESAKDAQELLGHTKFDLLITDFDMPDTNGADLIKNHATQYPNMATIVMTGYSGTDIEHELSTIDSLTILKKPFDLNELTQALESSFN